MRQKLEKIVKEWRVKLREDTSQSRKTVLGFDILDDSVYLKNIKLEIYK